MIRAIVMDIEGTTGSIRFGRDVLFPYARRRMAAFVRQRGEDPAVADQLAATRELAGEPEADRERLVAILDEWIAADRRVTPLKALQGMIWEEGYRRGDLTGHVYPDAVEGMKAWHAAGIPLYIFSSGSARAQKLLFAHSEAGDLTPLLTDYFDTTTGPKKEAESYRRIAAHLGLAGHEILFLSDVVDELDAAAAADFHTTQLVREAGMITGDHPVAASFTAVRLPES
ncbi:enolase-phosphatase E1 [Modicisalibacter ilicicola DSM 19980]|uniref:Enolase-phosphatase E1 n=1 Tax=Modicisalibacter ilicicola DSM 19980 TaxID=1121942 RepID=A0A1M4UND0_9GAMM|nr:acireductone synthase [Halomonas ilicicola]SHE58229.1 enolase-phosphatase E1 [Halomonas ilicicola DSM 19980]